MIFVFGSNLLGIHGAGAALTARARYGAVMGQGEGLQGDSYALPTCKAPGEPLDLKAINYYVDKFLNFAAEHPGLQFQVTAIGCGIAGYTPGEIAPMFFEHKGVVPENIWLPMSFLRAMFWYGYQDAKRETW